MCDKSRQYNRRIAYLSIYASLVLKERRAQRVIVSTVKTGRHDLQVNREESGLSQRTTAAAITQTNMRRCGVNKRVIARVYN